MSIDGALEDIPGVTRSETNYAKARTVVTYDPAAVSLDAMIAAVKELGYDAVPA
jgi:copper chaperone CopZ